MKNTYFFTIFIYTSMHEVIWNTLKFSWFEGTCSDHIPIDHTSSACIWNGKKCGLYFWKTYLSLQCVSWQALLCSNHPATYVLFHNVNSVWNMIAFSQCALEEITLNFIQQYSFIFFDFTRTMCVSVCFSTILTMQKNVSSRMTLNFIHLLCGFFVFITGTSSDWSCSFDGTPVNDVYTAWSKANKSFCTCFWNSGELFSLILRSHWNSSLGKSNQMSHVFLHLEVRASSVKSNSFCWQGSRFRWWDNANIGSKEAKIRCSG